MTDSVKPLKRKRLNRQLLNRIFPIFLIILITISIFQIYTEYNLRKNIVKDELTMIQRFFEPGLTQSLWDANISQAIAFCKGIDQSRSVIGITMTGDSNVIYNSYKGKENDKGVFVHQFDLIYKNHFSNDTGGQLVGMVKIYSSSAIIFERLQVSTLLIFGNVTLLSTTLLIFFLITFKRVVAAPLEELTSAVSGIDLNSTEKKRIHLHTTDQNEISLLEKIINQMLEKISLSQESLTRLNQHLEEEVDKRTKELEIAMELSETANKAKSKFLSNMSHEIRTPMNAILGFTEILKTLETDPKKAEFINTIHTSGLSLLRLINDILDISKIEAGKMKLHFMPVSLPSLHRFLRSLFSEKIKDQGLSLDLVLDESVPKNVMLDERRLCQVFTNLIGNALKFTSEGFIKLSTTCRLSETGARNVVNLVFTISDTGIGISKDWQNRVFGTFEQFERQKEKLSSGTGLGLAISKQIVELMGGTIQLESEEGVGSTFTIVLPDIEVVTTGSPPQKAERIDPKAVKFASADILIADDIEYNLEILEAYLEDYDLTLHFAENGKETIEKARELSPDIILLDMKMPVMDGYEASFRLKESPDTRNIPIIAITAFALKQDEEEILKTCDGYIRKPVMQREVIKELMQYLPYEIIEVSAPSPHATSPEKPGKIIPPPLEELKTLYDLARGGLISDISLLMLEIKKQDPAFIPFAEEIERRAKHFQDEEIIQLVEKYLE